MKVPKIIFELGKALEKAEIDYRVGGGQAAVFYGLRDKAEDWDLAVEEITPELEEIMTDLGFVEIPDSEGLSWEGPTLVDFIVADGEDYPTLEELGLHPVEGLRFVARSMMGYINWKEGESAYQHLKEYREKIEQSELPKPVQEVTDLKRFREASLSFAAPVQLEFGATYENVVHASTSPSFEDLKSGVVDFYFNTDGIARYFERVFEITNRFKVVVADIVVQKLAYVNSYLKEKYGFTKPFEVKNHREALVNEGIEALLWQKYNILQVLNPKAITNIRKFDSSEFEQVIDETQQKQDTDSGIETRQYSKPSGSEEMSVAEKLASTVKKLRAQRVDVLPGGVGDDLDYDDVDPVELEKGIEIEMEHVGEHPKLTEEEEEELAADITVDHLAEIKDYNTRLLEMEEEAKEEGAVRAADLVKKVLTIASKLEQEERPLQASLLDRLVQEAGLVIAYEMDFTELAMKARKQRVADEVVAKATGVPKATIEYYRALESVLKQFAQLLDQAESLDRGSQKYVDIQRYITDAYNTKYDPYNTDHVPTKIRYILALLRIDDIVRHNLDKLMTPEMGADTVVEKMTQMLKDQGLLKEFNQLKKAID